MLCGGSEHQAKFRSLIRGEQEEASRLIDLEMLLNKPVLTHTHTHTHTHTPLSHILTHALTKPGHKCQNSTTSNV